MQTRGWALALTLLLSLVIPTMAIADDTLTRAIADDVDLEKHGVARGPLVNALRSSVIHSFRNSPPPGYVPDPYCVSGVNGGAVGIHFINGSLIDDVLNPVEPEVLYYEPLRGGGIRLVGVEYVYISPDPFNTPPAAPQHLEGHLLNYMVEPTQFGVPFDWLRLNVWAWKRNPNGTFASDNPMVSCDAYDPNLHPQP